MGPSTISAQPTVTAVDISDLAAAYAGMDLIELDGMSLQSLPLQAKQVIDGTQSRITPMPRWWRWSTRAIRSWGVPKRLVAAK